MARSDQERSDFPAPERALDPKPRSGRIVARVGYSRTEKSIDALLGCIRAKRHAVTRAGARNWPLQRKLQMPPLWTATFGTPTWMDFLRLNHRLTAADKKVGQHLLACMKESFLHSTFDRTNDRGSSYPCINHLFCSFEVTS
ncbi:MFS transporter [Mesorhizobium sp. M1004]|uniref:MFS transporter n=1 Tax=Mesorhizobium sp. M1004 TaxID=2957046 RepID=UPI00333B0CAA